MNNNTDVLIIGAGPAGVRAASILADAGKKVTIVGKVLGGAYCAEGGVASGALLQFSSSYEKFRNIDSLVQCQENVKPDFKKLHRYVESIENKAIKLFADTLNDENITFIECSAKFVSPNSVILKDKSDKEILCKFKKCIIATGASNQVLPIAVGKKLLSSSSLSSISTIPSSVTIIGGGFIGIEIATFFARFGSKINLVEKNERILSKVDVDIVKKYEDTMKKRGISVYAGKSTSKIERIGQKSLIFFDDMSIESEEIFICNDRVADTSGLGLMEGGIELSSDGIPIFNTFLKTTNENVYVVGDANNILHQISWAYYSASIAARNILGNKIEYDMFSCPSILPTDPAITLIGLSEENAKKMGYEIGVVKKTCGDIFSFISTAGSQTFIKAIYDKKNKAFLGTEAIGKDAKDVINNFALIMRENVTSIKNKRVIFSSFIFNEFFCEALEKMR